MKSSENKQTKPLCQQFLEKFVAPRSPKGRVTCHMQYRYKESFLQVLFYNPQDSDMIRVPNLFDKYRVKVKVAEKRDQDMVNSWISKLKETVPTKAA